MARRIQTLTIDAEGRDQGKIFVLKEMPAEQAEKWAGRAILALAKSGVEVPDDVAAAGLAGVASVGIKAFGGIAWDMAEPLLDEMFTCVTIQPNVDKPQITRRLVEDDIEEVATRLKIRIALFELHTGFSVPAIKSITALAGQSGQQPN